MLLQRKNDSRDASSMSLTRYACTGATVGGSLFDAEHERRAGEQAAKRELNAGLEGALLRGRRDRTSSSGCEVGFVDRPPIGAARERRRESSWRSASSLGCAVAPARHDEDAPRLGVSPGRSG